MNRNPVVLVIDVGLTNCKLSLFDKHGRLVGIATESYPTHTPQPGWSEQEPHDWWQAICRCAGTLSAQALPHHEVIAISFTAHMHGVIPIRRTRESLMPCITLFDQRALPQASTIRQQHGLQALHKTTGGRFESYAPLAKIAWIRDNRPDIFRQAELFLAPKDMLRVLLGGEPVTDTLDAAGTLAYDLGCATWANDLLQEVGVPAEKLPEIRSPFANAGVLSARAADALGLTPGIPLLTGAGDDIEALGAGLITPGQTLEHIGTTGNVLTVVADPLFDAEARVEVYPGALEGQYMIGGATNAAGRSLDWARRSLHAQSDGTQPLPLTDYAQEDALGLPYYLPFINGERGLLWNEHAAGVIWGLSSSHTAEDLARAVYEGVAFSLKEILSANIRLGAPVTSVISGAVDSGTLWTQLRADTYGLPLAYGATDYLTGLGCAILALVQQGVFADAHAAVTACCTTVREIQPRPAKTTMLEARYQRYVKIVKANQALFHQ